ncbi:MAG: cytochrome c [Sphingomonadales bacterium]|nr:cytochrome c [Sphingomonadales bacterium]MDE2567368.1 cytochrome c [Sphingomonadales bacterium]
MRLAVASLALVAVGAGSALAQSQKLGEVLPQRSPEKVYASTCGYCHGTNIGPIIRGRGLPAEAIKYQVRHGAGAMPAFRPTEISPAELDALATWLEHSKADPKEKGK